MMVYPSHSHCRAILLISSDIADKPPLTVTEEKVAIREDDLYLKKAFFEERALIAPRETLPAAIPIALFYGEKDHKVVRAIKEIASLGITLFPFPESGHLFESVESRKSLARQMHVFLKNILSPLSVG